MPEIATKWIGAEKFVQQFGSKVLETETFSDQLCYVIEPSAVREIALYLKQEGSFEILMDLFAMDYLKSEPFPRDRFAVVYIFYSVTTHTYVRLKAYLPESVPEIASLVPVFACADWFEREAWDLFGIQFQGHPNLVRILCHSEFEGHPLRKDYPADKYQRAKIAINSSRF